jgi:alkanesulfonate monooxygenase SsuD/methylene tetrahydromethanopterin reductase-like flavin-dependent oxidoreductase (luciferase family)
MGERPIRLGLLEFGELPLRDVIKTAQLAEELGFARFWLTEHLGLIENSLLVTPLIAGATSRIRVGPAGVLLRYYPAAVVGRDGVFLERAFPGRIDLGLAGGRHREGTDLPFLDGRTHLHAPETLQEKIRVVAETVAAHEPAEERPELWVLGSSDSPERARAAARAHAHFSLSLMHRVPQPSPLAIRAYREEEERLGLAPGQAGVAITLACVESARARKGHQSPYPGIPGKAIVETAAVCRERIEEICREYDVSEVAILECSVGIERRCASIRMLIEAFGGRITPGRSAAREGNKAARDPTSGPRRSTPRRMRERSRRRP